MNESERSVIERLRQGDARAYEIILDELHSPVYRFILRMCRDSATAEDLTQETFVAVWQGIGSFQGRSKLKTWVFSIAYRQFLRHKDRRRPETVPLDEDRDESDCAEPSALLQETERKHLVREAVHGLPEMYRDVVCLVHMDGLTYNEAAEVLCIPAGTVKSRMNSAFQLLREKLGRCEVDDDEM